MKGIIEYPSIYNVFFFQSYNFSTKYISIIPLFFGSILPRNLRVVTRDAQLDGALQLHLCPQGWTGRHHRNAAALVAISLRSVHAFGVTATAKAAYAVTFLCYFLLVAAKESWVRVTRTQRY
jgi:hypothetical protein